MIGTRSLIIDQLSSLALKCVEYWPDKRPSTEDIIEELASVLAIMEGRRQGDAQPNPWGSGSSSKKCCLCARRMQDGGTCSEGHFFDVTCLEGCQASDDLPIQAPVVPCPIGGCVSFADPDLYGKISISTFCLMQWNRIFEDFCERYARFAKAPRKWIDSSLGIRRPLHCSALATQPLARI